MKVPENIALFDKIRKPVIKPNIEFFQLSG
jgi:hypothetical protein